MPSSSDFGTEFVVDVSPEQSEVRVLTGEVELRPATDLGGQGNAFCAGQGGRVGRGKQRGCRLLVGETAHTADRWCSLPVQVGVPFAMERPAIPVRVTSPSARLVAWSGR